MGKETYIFLFFWALKRFVNEEFDPAKLAAECGAEGEKLFKRMQEINPISLQELLRDVRTMGNLKIYACTGAVKLMELEESFVDEFDTEYPLEFDCAKYEMAVLSPHT